MKYIPQRINSSGSMKPRLFRRDPKALLATTESVGSCLVNSAPSLSSSHDVGEKTAPFRSLLYMLLLLATSILASSCGSTQRLLEPEPDWVFLGQRKASHLRENDVFKIKNKDKFAVLKLYVYNRSISIKRVEITLINGDVLKPALDAHINAGDRSRTIELSSDGRQIDKITIRYKSDGRLFSDKALVQIGGLRAQDLKR